MATTRVVREPEAGRVYEIAVHGEPPEGAEVLWRCNVFGSISWENSRPAIGDTHWMLAPVPADPPVEEPAFPLSREEWAEADGEIEQEELISTLPEELRRWWRHTVRLAPLGFFDDFDVMERWWRSADCPGADTGAPAEEQEEAEGPWRHDSDLDGEWLVGPHGATLIGEKGHEFPGLHFLISDANAYHREKAAREEAEAEAERLRGELERVTSEVAETVGYRGNHDDIPMTVWTLKRDLDEAKASLGRTEQLLHESRIREDEVCSLSGAETVSRNPAAVRSLVDRAEKAEKGLGVRTRQFHNALANETNLGRQARKLKEALDAPKKVKLYEPRLLPTDYASCATPSHGEDG